MANNNKVMKITAADFEKVVRNAVNQRMKIAGATGQGGSPRQLYKSPVTNPGRGEAVYGTEKGGQRFFEFLKAMMIDPANNIKKTGGPLANDDDYGEGNVPGHPDWKLSHQGQHYGSHGQPIEDPAKGMLPSGELIHMEHMEQSPEEHKRNKEMHIKNYGQQAGASSRQIRDRLKGFTKGKGYDDSGGSLRGIPDALRLQLLRDAMAQAPANNIKSLQSSGHQTVLDDNRPGHLKIIKQFKPKA